MTALVGTAPESIGDLVGLDVDSRIEIRGSLLEAGSSRPAIADMGGDKLGINASGIDDGEPKDECHEGGPLPRPWVRDSQEV